MVSNSECSFKRSKMDDTCCTSPLLLVFGSLFAVKSNTRSPLNTNPIITPSNASSIRCLVLFHRPPTWIVDCLLNTLSWCPANIKRYGIVLSKTGGRHSRRLVSCADIEQRIWHRIIIICSYPFCELHRLSGNVLFPN